MTKKLIRDAKGRIVKGSASLNPSGRPRLDGVRKYLSKMAGEHSEEFFNFLMEIMTYNQKEVKDRIPKYNANHKLKAVELLLAYHLGKPTQHNETEISTPESRTIQVQFVDDDETDA